MDFYELLEKLVDNSTMGEPNQKAAREVINTLKGVNAFGTVIAATRSESEGTAHVHNMITQWCKYDTVKLEDVCTTCGMKSEPYEPTWKSRKW
jgi:hypothetical protein